MAKILNEPILLDELESLKFPDMETARKQIKKLELELADFYVNRLNSL